MLHDSTQTEALMKRRDFIATLGGGVLALSSLGVAPSSEILRAGSQEEPLILDAMGDD